MPISIEHATSAISTAKQTFLKKVLPENLEELAAIIDKYVAKFICSLGALANKVKSVFLEVAAPLAVLTKEIRYSIATRNNPTRNLGSTPVMQKVSDYITGDDSLRTYYDDED